MLVLKILPLENLKNERLLAQKKIYFKYNKQLQPISLVYFLKYALGTKKLQKFFKREVKKTPI